MTLQEIDDLQTFMEGFNSKLLDLKEAKILGDNSEKTEEIFVLKMKMAILEMDKLMPSKPLTKAQRLERRKKLLDIICECAEVDKDALLNSGKSRTSEFRIPRQVYMALVHKVFGLTQAKAAATFGLDHATALYACNAFKNDYKTDKNYRDKFGYAVDFCYKYDADNGTSNTDKYLG